MAALHLLLGSSPSAWQDCVASLQAGDAVLLVDAGVGLLAEPNWIERIVSAGPGSFAASAPDVAARGLDSMARQRGVALIEDGAWVDAVCRHAPVLSWI